jgi:hypothetical protein
MTALQRAFWTVECLKVADSGQFIPTGPAIHS